LQLATVVAIQFDGRQCLMPAKSSGPRDVALRWPAAWHRFTRSQFNLIAMEKPPPNGNAFNAACRAEI
jgi:hypothetical protein